jgi:DNA polymerase-3 subunit gamma/tau
MDNFIVSARKYRPTDWDSVVGQSSITDTLQNAIDKNHLAQAFLFCGPRGVGKTTTARILAKAVNKEALSKDGDGFDENEDFAFNIFELDAASNNAVDDIRNLIDQVRIPPQVGSYKVYIIDEVHMLSTAAFNAFLKTLEEPPAHAIFILATTEKHKIIPTILSRCQVFDFHRIQIKDMVEHLKDVAQKENVTAEEDALHLIAEKADGGMRDALSIFDQMVSFAGNEISYKDVIQNLNILDYDYYFKTTDLILNGNVQGLLNLFNEVLDNGFDGHIFINGLSTHFRNLLVSNNDETIKLLEAGESIKQRYLDQAKSCDQDFLMAAIKLCTECDFKYKSSKNQRLLVELTLMQLASIQKHPEKKNY